MCNHFSSNCVSTHYLSINIFSYEYKNVFTEIKSQLYESGVNFKLFQNSSIPSYKSVVINVADWNEGKNIGKFNVMKMIFITLDSIVPI